ncbi:GMC family oxidoreductase [Halocynthiibacter namhaensis]|uniref:GMC family oxidoreductase n=1 Tax=Halocynthiibacter namhaensis TaxID=1290553 RepID=UPI0005793310|nr:GMC family oxidoreductase [Halocynthiibacter namhaensis]
MIGYKMMGCHLSDLTADIAILGGGSAGVEIARMAALSGQKVLLIEQGRAGGNHPFQRIPLMVGKIIGNPHFVDSCASQPQAPLNDRQTPVLAGRGLGGSSRINGNVAYTGPIGRYHKVFAHLGLDFTKTLLDIRSDAPRVTSWYDGLSQKFIKAGEHHSHDQDLDFLGAGHLFVNTKWGLRRNHFDRFKAAKNVNIIHAKVEKLQLEGRRVQSALLEDGRRIQAGRFILASGAVGSPKVLMQSGIGPADQLEKHDISVQLDQPQVGAHLKDHANIRIGFSCDGHDTLNQKTRGIRAFWEGVKYCIPLQNSVLRGPGASAGLNLATGDPYEDALRLQLVHFTQDRSKVAQKGIQFERTQGASIGIYQLWPKSEGRVALGPNGVTVDPGFFSDPRDIAAATEGVQNACDLVTKMGFQAENLRDDLRALVKDRAYSGYHLIGSNRMANTSQDGVVGADFSVFGLDNLDICDASVMPDHLSSHSYLPTIAMARMYGTQVFGA